MARQLAGALLLLLMAATAAAAQGRGGGGGGGADFSIDPMRLARLERFELALKLDKEQKKAVKAVLDEGHKNAAPVRQQLSAARASLGAAVVAGKPQDEIDTLTRAYGVAAAAMTRLEMQALGDILKPLPDAQRSGAGRAFSMIRGIFLDEKKWDVIPEAEGY
jgi:hypothetical protein